MNCPLCSSPMLFGATACSCGYDSSSSKEQLAIDLTYWEGLRAYWRVYWPTQVAGAIFIYVLRMILLRMPGVLAVSVSIAFGAVALYLFIPRICSRSYRGFSLVVVEAANGGATHRLRARWRFQVFVFLWWRQILAGLLATVLSMPLNALLAIIGLQLAQWIAVFAGVLVIGPILLKMLIGYQFGCFRIEARRTQEHGVPAETPDTQATVG